jgi:clathrin heavy chain
MEVDHVPPDPHFVTRTVDIFLLPEAADDFPVAMEVSKKYGIVYLITKCGFISLYHLDSGTCIYSTRISNDTIFVTAAHESTNGIICVSKEGQILSVHLNEQTIIPYIRTILNNSELAFKLASTGDLPGAGDLFVAQYQQLLEDYQFYEAAKVAANAPRVSVRNYLSVVLTCYFIHF